jgi:hypothetical protein
MNRFLFASLTMAFPLLALAQQPPKPEPTAPAALKPEASINRRQMEEDIEIMRRLLAKPVASQFAQQCITCHTNPWGGSGSSVMTNEYYYQGWMYIPQDPHHSGLVPMLPVEGNYLKGYGVAFQLVLPPQKNVLKDLPAVKGHAESDWDNARRELHGEKVTAAKPSPESPSVAEVLLKVMADNGKHFEYLPETENITIVVTFRGPAPVHSFGAPAGRTRPMAGGGMSGMSPPSGFSGGKASGGPFGSASTSSQGASGSSTGTSGAPTGSTSAGGSQADFVATLGRDYELLGDLHVRQGKINEAIDAYSKAANAAKTATIAQPAGEDAKANVERVKQRVRDLSVKLARVLLDAGRVDEAQKALVMDTQIKVLPPSASGSPPVPLPAKLTISAPKKLLEAVGSGKISYDEFRKQVTLDYSSLSEPAPMPSEPKKK